MTTHLSSYIFVQTCVQQYNCVNADSGLLRGCLSSLTWNIMGVEAEEKLKLLLRWTSGSFLAMLPLIITVFAVPCSPISNTAWENKHFSFYYKKLFLHVIKYHNTNCKCYERPKPYVLQQAVPIYAIWPTIKPPTKIFTNVSMHWLTNAQTDEQSRLLHDQDLENNRTGKAKSN